MRPLNGRGVSLVIDYDFYVNSYLGTAIPEKAFPGLAARALDALQAMRRRYQVKDGDEISEKMALCAMAEAIHQHRPGVASASVGSVSVRYAGGSLQRLLLERAGVYLDIYRGLNGWKLR